jgi:hypothetical protein
MSSFLGYSQMNENRQLEFVLKDYVIDHINELPQSFKWDFSLDKYPGENPRLSGENAYEKNKKMRLHIARRIASDSDLSTELQKWYVKEWGGVRGNREKTLDEYIELEAGALIDKGTAGVATWSKMLSLRDPTLYAIYDARVALSLNSLLKKAELGGGLMFPQLPSRNRRFVQPTQSKIIKSQFFIGTKKDFYQEYISILQNVAKGEAWDIQDVEMLLFSNAQALSTIW